MKIYSILIKFFNTNSNMLTQLAIHITVLWVALTFINHISKNLKLKIKADPNNATLLNILLGITKLTKIITVLLVISSFLQCNGYSLTSLMTGLGITGLAVGFAAKESLSSLLGSIAIMTDKVYKIGDYVIINDVEGVVEAINFRSTKIKTVDNILITIPNNITADTIVKNRSESKYLKLIENFDIEYDTSDEKIELAIQILKNICHENKNILNDYYVYISKLGENAITIQVLANTHTNIWMKYLLIKEELYKETLKQFRKNEIDFAFPSRTVYMRKDEN